MLSVSASTCQLLWGTKSVQRLVNRVDGPVHQVEVQQVEVLHADRGLGAGIFHTALHCAAEDLPCYRVAPLHQGVG